MPNYLYRARNSSGKAVKGVLEAVSKDALTEKLHRMDYVVTHIEESVTGIDLKSVNLPFQRVGSEDLIMFNVQLSNMINAGLSILSCLETLAEKIENRKLKKVIQDVVKSIESGDSFSEGLSKHPEVFSSLLISMVKAGEASGKLDSILARFAVYVEEEAELKQKVRGALFYPGILLVAGVLVTLYIVTYIIPQFVSIFIKAGITLPMTTLVLYNVGLGVKQFWLVLLLVAFGAALLLHYYAKIPEGRRQIDQFKLQLPVMGSLFRKVAVSRFSRTLGMLVESGVPILQSLDLVKPVTGNVILGQVIGNVRNSVEKGEKISQTLKVSTEFPPDTVQMIAIGEETGKLDTMLHKVADFYDRAIAYSVRRLTTVIEPILLGVMGAMVGFIMASMLLPMFDMMKILRG